MTSDPPHDSSDLSDASQWVSSDQTDGRDPERSFALVVLLWALGLPLFIGILLFVGLLTVESDNNGFWVLIAGVIVLIAASAIILLRNRTRT
jgi:hypothetical protein